MNTDKISRSIEPWIRLSVLLPGAGDRDHCHGLRRDFALPGCPDVDFLSYRHQEPMAAGAPHLFTVGLWRVVDGAVTSHVVRDMALSLMVLRGAYAQLLEDAECRGWRRRHRFVVQGNILGRRFERNTLIDTLSAAGREIVFWTFTIDEGRPAVDPYYIDGGVEREERPLEGILDHLAWDQPAVTGAGWRRASRARASSSREPVPGPTVP
jgi:hypothetical protein